MARISQDDARVAARNIVEPINKKMIEVEEQIRTKVTEWVTGQVPADVMKVFKGANFEYVKTEEVVRLYEHGFNGRQVNINGHVPMIRGEDRYQYPKFALNKSQADQIQKLVDKKDKLKDKYDTTYSEVQSSILTLGSHKRVLEEFPEAYGFLPGVNTNQGLAVQLQPVRAKVACLMSDDEDKKCIDKL